MLLNPETRKLEIKATSGPEQQVKASLKEGVGIAGLKVQEKVLGVINVSNKLSGEDFTAADEKLLTTLASQAAIAIENAHLVGELQEKKSQKSFE